MLETTENSTVLSAIGGRLRRLRKTNNLSQRQVAEAIGLPQSNLSRIENGKQRLNLVILARMLTIYHTTIQEFFTHHQEALESADALTPRERQLVQAFRRLSVEERRDVEAYVDYKIFRGRSRQTLGREPGPV